MKKIILLLILFSTQLTKAQIVNGGFEVWDSVYTHTYASELTNVYGVPNPYGGFANHWTFSSWFGNCRTTDSHSGNYSLILHNWYNYAREWATYDDSINYSPSFLQGYFKYIKGGTHAFAHGALSVALTRFNGVVNDTVALGSYVFDTAAVFTPFEVVINYFSFQSPDSIHIYIINASDSSGWSFVVSNLLYLDDLTLSDSPLSIDDVSIKNNSVTVFPYLVQYELNIANHTSQPVQFFLYNSLGEKIFDHSMGDGINTLNVSGYPSGVYFYNIIDSRNKLESGKIIKQ